MTKDEMEQYSKEYFSALEKVSLVENESMAAVKLRMLLLEFCRGEADYPTVRQFGPALAIQFFESLEEAAKGPLRNS